MLKQLGRSQEKHQQCKAGEWNQRVPSLIHAPFVLTSRLSLQASRRKLGRQLLPPSRSLRGPLDLAPADLAAALPFNEPFKDLAEAADSSNPRSAPPNTLRAKPVTSLHQPEEKLPPAS